MKKIDNKLYYQVAAWMINDLNLKGQELICYAIIYSLSQLGQGRYLAGLDYLASFMQCSQPTASKALKGLQKRGLIKKEEVTTDTGRRVLYYCSNPEEDEKESYRGVNKNFIDGVNKKFMDNNINNKEDNNINKKRLSNDNQKVDELFDKFWEEYDYKKSKKDAIKNWNKLTDADKEIAIKAIPLYKQDCKHYQRSMQHPATYLSKRTFEDDFNIIPEYYQNDANDNSTEARYKRYMIKTFPNLIYHRNPLTFEQYMYFVEEYNESGRNYVNESLEKLNTMEINQFISIEQGLKRLLKESKEDRVYGDE